MGGWKGAFKRRCVSAKRLGGRLRFGEWRALESPVIEWRVGTEPEKRELRRGGKTVDGKLGRGNLLGHPSREVAWGGGDGDSQPREGPDMGPGDGRVCT